MKKSRFNEEQIIRIITEGNAGGGIDELYRKAKSHRMRARSACGTVLCTDCRRGRDLAKRDGAQRGSALGFREGHEVLS